METFVVQIFSSRGGWVDCRSFKSEDEARREVEWHYENAPGEFELRIVRRVTSVTEYVLS